MNTNHTYENMSHLDKADVMHEMVTKLEKDRYNEILDNNIESGQIIVSDIDNVATLYKIDSYKSVLLGNYIHDIYEITDTRKTPIDKFFELYNQGIKDNTDWGY